MMKGSVGVSRPHSFTIYDQRDVTRTHTRDLEVKVVSRMSTVTGGTDLGRAPGSRR